MSEVLARIDGQEVALQDSWAPAVLQEQVELEKQRRTIMVDYFRSCMQENHHFYRLPGQEDRKPALSKEGALNICSLYKVVAVPDDPAEIWHGDGHYTVRYRTRILSIATGQLVAVGDGMCSTRESKYAYRYASQICPHCGKAAIIKGRDEYGGGWLCFKRKDGCGAKFKDGDPAIEAQSTGRMPNEDAADQYNTVLKMAEKRSLVDAGLKLPLVSELFTQDLEEQVDVSGLKKQNTTTQPDMQPSGNYDESVRTDEPQALSQRQPTPDQITKLIELAKECGVPLPDFSKRIKEYLHWGPEVKISKKYLRETLTMAQYDEIYQIFEEHRQSQQAHDDEQLIDQEVDVLDYPTHEATPEPPVDTPSASVTIEASEDADATTGQVEPLDAHAYATAKQIFQLNALAKKIGDDAYTNLQHTLEQHPEGLPREEYDRIHASLLKQQAD